MTKPVQTDAERRANRRDAMRRLRAQRTYASERLAETLAWSFESICQAVGLTPSPQSTLNPEIWRDRIQLRGLSIRGMQSKKKR